MILLLRPLAWVNTHVLRLSRWLGALALAIMVIVILTQVFFRYVLNDALAWPDEAARFLMLWLVALMAPSAMRWGGFVAIDTLPSALSRVPGLVLNLVLLLCALVVLLIALQHGHAHTFGFGGNFDSSSLRVPLELIGLEGFKIKLRYMYGALFFCVAMLSVVTVELILRTVLSLLSPDTELPDTDEFALAMGAAD